VNSTPNPQQERSRAWQRLQELENRAISAGLGRLTSEEVLELGRLYRRAAADLSQARALGLDPREVTLLNGLVGRAYGLIYTSERGGAASVARFFTHEFPCCFRRNFGFIAAAFLVVIAGGLIGLFASLSNRQTLDVLLGPQAARSLEQLGERHRAGHNWLPAEQRPFASSFIMTNNIKVSFVAFAGGILLGLITLLVLFQNGIILGVVAEAVARHGTALQFWGFVAPHGVIELPAIFVAGGAGLMLGYALVNPGEYSRRTALSLAGRDAVLLIFGVVAMLVIAGVIEGFFSPALLPPVFKLLVAAVTFTAEATYFMIAGRAESGVQAGAEHRLPPSRGGSFSPDRAISEISWRGIPPI
jgi:uncharacterized membrane protein SpoIIM required for sporulation